MEGMIKSAAWVVVSAATLAAPLLMVSSQLPRRPQYQLRLGLSLALLAAFQLLYVPEGPLSSTESISEELLVTGALFFNSNVLLMGAIVLFCHQTDLAGAAFCAVVGYTVENLAAVVGNIAGLLMGLAPLPTMSGTASFLLMSFRMAVAAALVYTVFYLTFIVRIRRRGFGIVPGRGAYLFLVAVIMFNVVFDIASKRLTSFDVPMGYVLLARLAVVAMCLYTLLLEYELLYSRHMQAEAAATERLLEDWKSQYEISRDTIEAINVKCHDIRHQIRRLEYGAGNTGMVDRTALDEIAREVNVYDSAVKTGNDALDTILTEKSLLGEREGIGLSCIADGEALSFMNPAEIYSLFGNAIENAMDAVRQLEDPEQRVVSLAVRRIAGMVSIHMENRCPKEVKFEGGVPQTSKADVQNHGFGFKSMQLVVERHGGAITADSDGETFFLNALIPIP